MSQFVKKVWQWSGLSEVTFAGFYKYSIIMSTAFGGFGHGLVDIQKQIKSEKKAGTQSNFAWKFQEALPSIFAGSVMGLGFGIAMPFWPVYTNRIFADYVVLHDKYKLNKTVLKQCEWRAQVIKKEEEEKKAMLTQEARPAEYFGHFADDGGDIL